MPRFVWEGTYNVKELFSQDPDMLGGQANFSRISSAQRLVPEQVGEQYHTHIQKDKWHPESTTLSKWDTSQDACYGWMREFPIWTLQLPCPAPISNYPLSTQPAYLSLSAAETLSSNIVIGLLLSCIVRYCVDLCAIQPNHTAHEYNQAITQVYIYTWYCREKSC